MPGPLDGVRVLDLTGMISGPMATMILADQGADVIKIEPPAGDLMRRYGVMRRGMSSSFLSNNHGKRSLCVDIKAPEGLAAVLKLAATADVLVQNFRPGAIERMGLGEDAVRAVRPDIVYVSISGFGERGPYVDQRVYDPVIQALSGLAEIQSDRQTGQPRMVRTVIPDKTTAVTAAQAVTAALFARERTGKGQHVRLAMLDTMIAYLWPEASSSLSFVGDESDPARGQMGLDLVFRTQDRHITAGAVAVLRPEHQIEPHLAARWIAPT
jgi:crotonobetainyl-CoA:carnitine CoA-transferase CaiB-like acyl-CoA transferase